MALDMEQLARGTTTATAINASFAMLKMRANLLYYHIEDFLRQACALLGTPLVSLSVKEMTMTNELERLQAVYLARDDIGKQKALELNPFIEPEEVEGLMNEQQKGKPLCNG